jgi:protein tyrosine phosphatase (PTP) superfamily phosphohydrolase (DUF442 family)
MFDRTERRPQPASIELGSFVVTCRCGARSQVEIAVTREDGRVRVQELAERCPSCGRIG